MEETNQPTSIIDIAISDDLTDKIQRSELIAYQKAIYQLEQEWDQLQKNENPDQKACINIIQDQHDRKHQKIEQKYKTRCQIVDQQRQDEIERVNREFEVAQSALKDHLIKAYIQSNQNITTQLKDLKGKDFQAYNAENSIDFPQMQAESQMDTRTKHHEEGKLRLTNQECENDLAIIQKIYEKDES